MAQNFTRENHDAVKKVHDYLTEGAFTKLPGALQTIVEQAERSGAEKLIKDCRVAAEEATPKMLKSYDQLMAVVEKYLATSGKVLDVQGL